MQAARLLSVESVPPPVCVVLWPRVVMAVVSACALLLIGAGGAQVSSSLVLDVAPALGPIGYVSFPTVSPCV